VLLLDDPFDGPSVGGPVYRIGLWLRPEKRLFVASRLRDAFGGRVEIVSGGAEFLDILPKGVSKGAALDRFLSTLPERPETVVAAGDHGNDLAMLSRADVAAVPRNAAEEALSAADIVMPAAFEHGVSALADHLLSPAFRADKKRAGHPLIL
jgi:hydroxymethylpyrimidine pyrophosphatase-like HAD family hydrolase